MNLPNRNISRVKLIISTLAQTIFGQKDLSTARFPPVPVDMIIPTREIIYLIS